MISTLKELHHLEAWQALVATRSDDMCQRQLREAERELGAYFTAVSELFGAATAARAAECWIGLVERTETPALGGYGNWRSITILAARRLSMEVQMSWDPVMQRTEVEAPSGKGHHHDQCRA